MTWLSTEELAAATSVTARTFRRWARDGKVSSRRKPGSRNASAVEIDARSLPAIVREQLADVVPSEPHQLERFGAASAEARRRGELRIAVVRSYNEATGSRRPAETKRAAEHRWFDEWQQEHSEYPISVSIRSARRWAKQVREDGPDALVDSTCGRDKGRAIPAPAQDYFLDFYLRPNNPGVSLAFEETRKKAAIEGWEIPGLRTFQRWVAELPPIVRLANREKRDTLDDILPNVFRDYTSIPAMHTIQADHHILDLPVRCDDDDCRYGHRPWVTGWIDVRSRRVLVSEIYLEAPCSERVLSSYRHVVERFGLNVVTHLDNGSDFQKAFGAYLRKHRISSQLDAPVVAQKFALFGVTVRWAKAYNAKTKGIERFFSTLCDRFAKRYDEYVGQLGSRSEQAKALYNEPSKLMSLSELAYELDCFFEEFNTSPHRGQGMDGRSPAEVFEATRMERRDPDAKAWAILFWEQVFSKGKPGRVVDKNGIRLEGRVYRLDSIQAKLNYFGKRVDVRVAPDRSAAILLDLESGAYICDAKPDRPASWDTSDEATRDAIERIESERREIRAAAIRQGRSSEEFQETRERYREIASSELAHAVGQSGTPGNVRVVAPQLSSIARDRDAVRSRPAGLTEADMRYLSSDEPVGPTRHSESLRSELTALGLADTPSEETESAPAAECAFASCPRDGAVARDGSAWCPEHAEEIFGG